MALHKCLCLQCHHQFYWLSVECRSDERVYCPICQGGVSIDDLQLPVGKKWAECAKGKCHGCQKSFKNELKVDGE